MTRRRWHARPGAEWWCKFSPWRCGFLIVRKHGKRYRAYHDPCLRASEFIGTYDTALAAKMAATKWEISP